MSSPIKAFLKFNIKSNYHINGIEKQEGPSKARQ